jgi:hypothetical protein
MYAKIFRQVFDSSLADDPEVMRVFIYMCVLADPDGVVDMTFNSISRTTRIPIEEVERSIRKLMQPDPTSRSFKEDGARLVLIDSGQRDWGWRIVNYKHYRSVRSEEERRSFFRGRRRCTRSKVIYYAVSGCEVKIGLSVNPAARIAKLKVNRPDVELAVKETGSEDLLQRRYSELANDRIDKGWFRMTAHMRDHIARVAACNPRSQDSKGSTRVAHGSAEVAKGRNGNTNSGVTRRGKTDNGVAPGSASVTRGSTKKPCTEAEVEIYDPTPLSSPQGETVEEQNISLEGTKNWLNSFFSRQKPWSSGEDSLLEQLFPIPKDVRALLSWGYMLPRDAEGWAILDGKKLTKPKQNLLALLREFWAEVEKWRSVRANLNGVEPDARGDGWTAERLTARNVEFPGAVFSGRFDSLPTDLQERIDARVKEIRAAAK